MRRGLMASQARVKDRRPGEAGVRLVPRRAGRPSRARSLELFGDEGDRDNAGVFDALIVAHRKHTSNDALKRFLGEGPKGSSATGVPTERKIAWRRGMRHEFLQRHAGERGRLGIRIHGIQKARRQTAIRRQDPSRLPSVDGAHFRRRASPVQGCTRSSRRHDGGGDEHAPAARGVPVRRDRVQVVPIAGRFRASAQPAPVLARPLAEQARRWPASSAFRRGPRGPSPAASRPVGDEGDPASDRLPTGRNGRARTLCRGQARPAWSCYAQGSAALRSPFVGLFQQEGGSAGLGAHHRRSMSGIRGGVNSYVIV